MNGTSIHSITRMNYVFVRGMARGAKRIESSTNNVNIHLIYLFSCYENENLYILSLNP